MDILPELEYGPGGSFIGDVDLRILGDQYGPGVLEAKSIELHIIILCAQACIQADALQSRATCTAIADSLGTLKTFCQEELPKCQERAQDAEAKAGQTKQRYLRTNNRRAATTSTHTVLIDVGHEPPTEDATQGFAVDATASGDTPPDQGAGSSGGDGGAPQGSLVGRQHNCLDRLRTEAYTLARAVDEVKAFIFTCGTVQQTLSDLVASVSYDKRCQAVAKAESDTADLLATATKAVRHCFNASRTAADQYVAVRLGGMDHALEVPLSHVLMAKSTPKALQVELTEVIMAKVQQGTGGRAHVMMTICDGATGDQERRGGMGEDAGKATNLKDLAIQCLKDTDAIVAAAAANHNIRRTGRLNAQVLQTLKTCVSDEATRIIQTSGVVGLGAACPLYGMSEPTAAAAKNLGCVL
jgi:hypothetical protein